VIALAPGLFFLEIVIGFSALVWALWPDGGPPDPPAAPPGET
jgi:hypothetical protein